MPPGVEGGMTRHLPGTEAMSIYDAAMLYQQENAAGGNCREEYGSNRRTGGKGPRLLGYSRGIAESLGTYPPLKPDWDGGSPPLEFPCGRNA